MRQWSSRRICFHQQHHHKQQQTRERLHRPIQRARVKLATHFIETTTWPTSSCLRLIPPCGVSPAATFPCVCGTRATIPFLCLLVESFSWLQCCLVYCSAILSPFANTLAKTTPGANTWSRSLLTWCSCSGFTRLPFRLPCSSPISARCLSIYPTISSCFSCPMSFSRFFGPFSHSGSLHSCTIPILFPLLVYQTNFSLLLFN